MRAILRRLRNLFNQDEFTIEIENGHARCVRGKLLQSLISEFTEIAGTRGISRGTIYGKRDAGFTRLAFSPEIPPSTHQLFRNVWSQYS